jgi:hypothetical protein
MLCLPSSRGVFVAGAFGVGCIEYLVGFGAVDFHLMIMPGIIWEERYIICLLALITVISIYTIKKR